MKQKKNLVDWLASASLVAVVIIKLDYHISISIENWLQVVACRRSCLSLRVTS